MKASPQLAREFMGSQPACFGGEFLVICILGFFSVVHPLIAECRLHAVWEEHWVLASAANGTQSVDRDNSGTAGVPGQGSFTASAATTQGESTTTQARAGYLSRELDKGFSVLVQAESFGRRGVFPWAMASSTIWIEFEVVGDVEEVIDLSLIQASHDTVDFGGASSEVLTYEVDNDGNLVPGVGYWQISAIGDDGWRFSISEGHGLNGKRFRFSFSARVMQHISSQLEKAEASYSCEVSFLNYSIEPGATQRRPILPPSPPASTARFRGVPSWRYYDPPLASGFQFIGVDGTLFESIVALPFGFQSGFEIWVDGVMVGTAEAGEGFGFASKLGEAVAGFEVRNIRPFVDGSSPTAFPIMLDFASNTGSFDMTAIPAPWVTVRRTERGVVEVDWIGILQSSSSLSVDSWETLDPQPVAPFEVELVPGETNRFFRAMGP